LVHELEHRALVDLIGRDRLAHLGAVEMFRDSRDASQPVLSTQIANLCPPLAMAAPTTGTAFARVSIPCGMTGLDPKYGIVVPRWRVAI
jgi:hypothetical protein